MFKRRCNDLWFVLNLILIGITLLLVEIKVRPTIFYSASAILDISLVAWIISTLSGMLSNKSPSPKKRFIMYVIVWKSDNHVLAIHVIFETEEIAEGYLDKPDMKIKRENVDIVPIGVIYK